MLQFEIKPDGLHIRADENGKERIKDSADESKTYAEIWEELLEPTANMDSFCFIRPEQIGALTDAPIIGQCVGFDEDGNIVPNENTMYWYFDEYQTVDEMALLSHGMTIIFIEVQK